MEERELSKVLDADSVVRVCENGLSQIQDY